MVYKSRQIFLPFCHNTRACQTDGRTDRQTDRILITIPRLHYMQRGKHSTDIINATIKDEKILCTVDDKNEYL